MKHRLRCIWNRLIGLGVVLFMLVPNTGAASAAEYPNMWMNYEEKVVYLPSANGYGVSVGTVDFTVRNKIPEWRSELKFKWTSTRNLVATVANAGIVTAHSVGRSFIRCEIREKKTNELVQIVQGVVIVKANAASVEISNAEEGKEMTVGVPFDFNRSMKGTAGGKATDKSYWFITENTAQAEVDSQGVVIAKQAGTFNLQVRTAQNRTQMEAEKWTAESEILTVTVTEPEIEETKPRTATEPTWTWQPTHAPTSSPPRPTAAPSNPVEEPNEPTDEPDEPTEEPSDPTEEPAEPTEPDPVPSVPGLEGYELLFADEFDSPVNGTVDESVWRFRTEDPSNLIGNTNRRGNVKIVMSEDGTDGRLEIQYRKDQVLDSAANEYVDVWTAGGVLTRKQFGYGYFEAKGTLYTAGNGVHSSFWLMGGSDAFRDSLKPRSNTVFEIDVFEFDSNLPDIYQCNLNYKIGRKNGDGEKVSLTLQGIETLAGASGQGREAVFGLLWMPNEIVWYLDGVEVRRVNSQEKEFHYAQQTLWLTALAGYSVSGVADSTTPEGATSFDYVRYYAKALPGVNLLGASEFEYNENPGFATESLVDLQTPLSFFEEGDIGSSLIKETTSAYAGRHVLTHEGTTDYAVKTLQKLYYIPNGEYELTAWVRSSGGQSVARITAGGYDASGGILSVVIPEASEWTQIVIPSVPVTSNEAFITIESDAAAGQWIEVDNISFHVKVQDENERVVDARPFAIDKLADMALTGGTWYVNARNANNTGSGVELYAEGSRLKLNGADSAISWRASGALAGPTVGSTTSTSIWREPADEDDYILFLQEVPASGRYVVEWFSPGNEEYPVQPGELSIYPNGYSEAASPAAIFWTGEEENRTGDQNWERLGYIELMKGDQFVAKFGTRSAVSGSAVEKIMLRAGALRIYTESTVTMKEIIAMNTEQSAAFVYGVRNSVNNVPRPVIRDRICYLPADWLAAQLRIPVPVGESVVIINGLAYISADDFKKAVPDYSVTVIEERYVIIAAESLPVSDSDGAIAVLKTCFGET